ncbi:hypothetical protein KAJ83_03720 [Marivibrio halodurans]|uniref:Basal-body rod modification protein FlgD n=1 Tax=Marivibrio halodurans TaxID=2039722 RepID=A0A8J7SH17_9PROT|nr:flagellar hook capping FlgD N-terminal domain-containing protein [Marivibrio halodurans]MBP5856103.1 hypothetical protein [Marivibrio halodurans]
METSAVNPFGTSGSTAKQEAAVTGLTDNFDNFLTILTTQLQNQDPLSPMDTHEFTNQLVAFAGVEQSVRQSGQLDQLISLNRGNEAMGAVSYIGQTVTADYNEFNFNGTDPVELSYTLPKDAKSAAMQVYTSEGDLVTVIPADKTAGNHKVTWDGKTLLGEDMPEGVYSFQLGAIDENEEAVEASYQTTGKITGVEYTPNETILKAGDVPIPLSRVLSVEETAGT